MAFNLNKYAEEAPKPDHPSGPKPGSGPGQSRDVGNTGRRRIRDRGIDWQERYREKSDDLKARFDDMIGPGSYYRWEGHDYTTDGDYFVVVGPAITKEGKKQFFAGVKRYPDDPKKKQFAPYGEYFPTIRAALSHAAEKWGIPMPQNQADYDESTLSVVKIPRHLTG